MLDERVDAGARADSEVLRAFGVRVVESMIIDHRGNQARMVLKQLQASLLAAAQVLRGTDPGLPLPEPSTIERG